jgi:predicted aldo/keto reductase-like oxidoreductase
VLKAVWADERISAAVSHMDTFEKLKDNVGAALDLEDLGQAEWKALENYARATRPFACDGCDHLCGKALPEPVKVGAVMRCLMYHDGYGDAGEAHAAFRKLPPASRRLSGVDFRAANRACPHGVDVAAHMRRAAEVFQA